MVLITGIQRSGTTFLLILFHKLGFDTGYSTKEVDSLIGSKKNIVGGLEWFNDQKGAFSKKLPAVVKHPFEFALGGWWRKRRINVLEELKRRGVIEHIFLCVRDTKSHIQSFVFRFKDDYRHADQDADSVQHQLARRTRALKSLLKDFPTPIKVKFPDSVFDFDYAYSTIGVPLNIPMDKFKKAWKEARNKRHVHHRLDNG